MGACSFSVECIDPDRFPRVETTALFAQTIYLLFAAVYVCKEAVEHLLLALGNSHHHHPGDEYERDRSGCVLIVE